MQNKSKSPFKIALSRFIHNKIAMLSIIFLLIITIVSIIAPLIAPFPVNQQDLLNIKGEMTAQNILGTDSGGRDNFSRLLYAGRISLSIGNYIYNRNAFDWNYSWSDFWLFWRYC